MYSVSTVFIVMLYVFGVGSNFIDLNADQRSLCPCGSKNHSVETRVVGGHDAGKGQFPYASCLIDGTWRSENSLPFCGATLITDSHVVTAAHCVRDRSADSVLVDVGDYDFSDDHKPRLRQGKSIVRFPGYHPGSFHGDIAIIEFKEPVQWESGVKASWLPHPDLQLVAGTMVSVYGWGRLSYGGDRPKLLQSVELPVIDNSDCQKKFRTHIEPIMLCAGGQKGHDACTGDSGSGLVVRLDNEYVLCGLVSFGRRCALPHVPGVYTRVSNFTTWIYENTLSSKCRPCIYGASPTHNRSTEEDWEPNITSE